MLDKFKAEARTLQTRIGNERKALARLAEQHGTRTVTTEDRNWLRDMAQRHRALWVKLSRLAFIAGETE